MPIKCSLHKLQNRLLWIIGIYLAMMYFGQQIWHRLSSKGCFDTSLTVCSWLSRFGGLWKGRWFIFGSQSFLLGGRFAPSGTCTVMFTLMSLMYHPPLFPPLPHHFSLLHCLWSVAIHPSDYHFLFRCFLPFFSLRLPAPPLPPLAFLALIKPSSAPEGWIVSLMDGKMEH